MAFIRRNDTEVTYAVGAGWEYALTNNWSIKAEYLYLGTQRSYANAGSTTGFAIFPIVAPPVPLTNSNSDPGIHTAKIGINYRWGGPIVAKY
jgi:outer membrane immunogenic protein